jgi:hypothetical protein
MLRIARCALTLLLVASIPAVGQVPPAAPAPAAPAAPAPGPAAAPGASPTSARPVARLAARIKKVHRRHHYRHHYAPEETEGPDLLAGYSVPGRLGVRLRLSDGHRIWQPTRKFVGVTYANGEDSSPYGAFTFQVDQTRLEKYLLSIAPYASYPAQPAHPEITDIAAAERGDEQVPAKIVPASGGSHLDIDADVKLIAETIATSPSTLKIVLPVVTTAPKASTVDLSAIDARIGYFVTRFNPGEVGRTQTVRLAIDKINGTILPPGGILSVNGIVGERTVARGFGTGWVFVDGKLKKDVGGGMCQVATTLFNASMVAGLKIVERHQHERTVPYVEPGRDATVWWGLKDFKVQNDTDAPLYVSYLTTYSHAIVALYGKAVPGRTVSLYSSHRRLGERWFTGKFYRVIKYPDGHVVREKPYYSDYKWTPALDYNG